MQYQQKKNKDLNEKIWDWILLIGVAVSPMQELRIWKVGPGEVLLLLWSLRYTTEILKLKVSNILVRFWILFLLAIVLGTCYGYNYYPKETTPSGIVTYVFFAFISLGIYAGFSLKSEEQIGKIIRLIGIVVPCWFMFLYLYSRYVSSTFLGTSLWFKNVRFDAGGRNPHQVAVTVSSVLFIDVILVLNRKIPFRQKILPLICVFFCIVLSIATRSSTLVVAFVLTFLFLVYYQLIRYLKDRRQKWYATSLLVIILGISIVIFKDTLYNMVYEWIESDANGLDRINIFTSFSETIEKNWLIGLGPGIHALNGTKEYHNSYLEIFAMCGFFGFTVFTFFVVRMFKKLRTKPDTLFMILPLYFYGLAGFSMRRMIFWVMTSILIAYSEQPPAQQTELVSEQGFYKPIQVQSHPLSEVRDRRF